MIVKGHPGPASRKGKEDSGSDHLLDLAVAIHDSSLVERASRFAAAAHGGPGRGEKEFSHPAAVADLVASRGLGEEVVAAALLHDTVEDTALTLEEIEASFGKDIAGLVAGVTEDARIHSYPARKAEARRRMMGDRRTAAIYAADKVASVRALLVDGRPIQGERLDHFARTLRLLSEGRPDLPFLAELAVAMATLIERSDRRSGTARCPRSDR
ncbi:MAG: HD domain-containing protein [Solirubrobacterales bacterium]